MMTVSYTHLLPADYDRLQKIADQYGMYILEDGAQGFGGCLLYTSYKSQKDGMPVKLPLKNFKSTDMTGEF